MKNRLLLSVAFISISISYGQEICNNGVDDDGDALIDLNDPNCICGIIVEVPSLIPNPSFEEFDYCPTWISQLDAAVSWEQATNATTDYFNSCGFLPTSTAYPFPTGNGAVGAHILEGYKEYLGACLSSPMLAGVNYTLKMDIFSHPSSTNGLFTDSNLPFNYGPLDITIYGKQTCANTFVPTTECPTSVNPQWFVIGFANYTPSRQWQELIINFIPTVDVNAIMIGGPCDLINYPSSGSYVPYFYFDDLRLNQSEFFNTVSINSTGDFCTGNVFLTASTPDSQPGDVYQWYVNGIAIVNATGITYSVAAYVPTDSYSVTITNGAECALSSPLILSPTLPPAPLVTSPLTYCENEIAPVLSANGTDLLWYTTATGGIGSPVAPTPSTSVIGTFTYYVSQTCVVESPRALITVNIYPNKIPDFPEIPPICFGGSVPILGNIAPNGIEGTWLPSEISSTQSGTYLFKPEDFICAVTQTLNVEVVPVLNFEIMGGCVSEVYIMEAFAEEGNLNNDDLVFQWTDSNGHQIGSDQPYIDLTQIVNASVAEEDFPLTYGLTITDNFGCEYKKNYTIEKAFCRIPKGISPNNDGDNDFFDLRGLGVKNMKIFNRYGINVYSLDNYTTEWHGQSDNGKALPDAAYYYYLTFDNEKPKTGWVYINQNN